MCERKNTFVKMLIYGIWWKKIPENALKKKNMTCKDLNDQKKSTKRSKKPKNEVSLVTLLSHNSNCVLRKLSFATS